LKLLDYTFVRLGEKFRNKSNGAFKQAQYPRDLRVI